MKNLILAAILLPLLASCVGKKQYLQVEYLHQQSMQRERQLQAQLDFARAQIGQLQDRNEGLSNEIGNLRNDKTELESDTSLLGERIRDMARRARSTQEELGSELEQKTRELEEKRARLAAIEQRVNRRDERLNQAYAELRDSLQSLSADDLTVELRDGRLYVSLSDRLLFGGRSTTITPVGEKALARVSIILNRYPDIDVLALGHTSTDRPNRGYDDNWDLSARRAAAAVRILASQYDVSPNQLTVAGKGEYLPIVANNSSENKLKNRRLELVLAPRLDLLYNLLREE